MLSTVPRTASQQTLYFSPPILILLGSPLNLKRLQRHLQLESAVVQCPGLHYTSAEESKLSNISGHILTKIPCRTLSVWHRFHHLTFGQGRDMFNVLSLCTQLCLADCHVTVSPSLIGWRGNHEDGIEASNWSRVHLRKSWKTQWCRFQVLQQCAAL